MRNDYTLNSECFDESQFPVNSPTLVKKVNYSSPIFRKMDKQSGKVDLTNLVIIGAILTTLTIGGVIIKNYVCKNVVPQIYQTIQEQVKK